MGKRYWTRLKCRHFQVDRLLTLRHRSYRSKGSSKAPAKSVSSDRQQNIRPALSGLIHWHHQGLLLLRNHTRDDRVHPNSELYRERRWFCPQRHPSRSALHATDGEQRIKPASTSWVQRVSFERAAQSVFGLDCCGCILFASLTLSDHGSFGGMAFSLRLVLVG